MQPEVGSSFCRRWLLAALSVCIPPLEKQQITHEAFWLDVCSPDSRSISGFRTGVKALEKDKQMEREGERLGLEVKGC